MNLPRRLTRLKGYSVKQKRSLFIAITTVVLATSGIVFAQAGQPFVSFLASNGLISGGAVVANDQNASDGHYLLFQANNNGSNAISTSCKYSTTVTPAFCETFDQPYSGTKTQTGDLDPILWGVSRTGAHNLNSQVNAVSVSHNACDGGRTTGNPMVGDPNSTTVGPLSPPPKDARICNGMYVESLNDGGTVAAIDAYPKQPFNFAGRTGRVVFDVTNDTSGSHGAWPEFVITDEPVPGTSRCISECPHQAVFGKNSIGFSLAGGDFSNGYSGVDEIFYSQNNVNNPTPLNVEHYETVKAGCLAGHSWNCPQTKLNHIEVAISTNRIDIYGTDAGTTGPLKHLAGANLNLNFSQGLVWINDVHYNARKAIEPNAIGTQYDHSFAWDNLGFDGPKTYRDLGYDVPLNNVTGGVSEHGDPTIQIGYQIDAGGSRTFSLPGVVWSQPPTKAKIVFNTYSYTDNNVITASLNGHTPVSITMVSGSGYHNYTGSIDLPASDVVQGTNSLKISTPNGTTIMSNISMILVAGAPVP